MGLLASESIVIVDMVIHDCTATEADKGSGDGVDLKKMYKSYEKSVLDSRCNDASAEKPAELKKKMSGINHGAEKWEGTGRATAALTIWGAI